MLEPGDRVRIDGGPTNWTIVTARRQNEVNYYRVAKWPNPSEEIPASRITASVVSHHLPQDELGR